MLREPENKKTPKKIWNSVVALVVLFMIPTIINAAMALVDDKSEISACWKGDVAKPDTNASYINPYTDEQQAIISDPSGYEVGSGGGGGSADDMQVTSCGNLEYCNKFLTSCYNNSRRLSDAIAKYQPPVEYNYGDSKKTWAEAIKAAQNRKLVATTCVVPTNWCVTDAIGKHKTLNSVGYGGFQGYSGPITNYTKQYKFNCIAYPLSSGSAVSLYLLVYLIKKCQFFVPNITFLTLFCTLKLNTKCKFSQNVVNCKVFFIFFINKIMV